MKQFDCKNAKRAKMARTSGRRDKTVSIARAELLNLNRNKAFKDKHSHHQLGYLCVYLALKVSIARVDSTYLCQLCKMLHQKQDKGKPP